MLRQAPCARHEKSSLSAAIVICCVGPKVFVAERKTGNCMVKGQSRDCFVRFREARDEDQIGFDVKRAQESVEKVGFVFAIAKLVLEDFFGGMWPKGTDTERNSDVTQTGDVVVNSDNFLAVCCGV